MDIIDFSKTPNVKKVKVGISLFIKFPSQESCCCIINIS